MTPTRMVAMVSAGAVALAGFLAVGAVAPATAAPVTAAVADDAVRIAPNPAYAAEPFEGWGTSLVWFANATGDYPADVRQALFDAVFGDEGLNLNIARYNIGGGNATDVPGYLRPGGAVDGWWNPELPATDADGEITSTYADRERYAAAWDGSNPDHYDFDADSTQRWWLDALKDTVTKWEAFSNSPPYFLTESGFVSGGINNATSEQLATEDMSAFADYLVTVVEHLEAEHDIQFETLTPFNEPNTNYWSTRIPAGETWPTSASRQEGAHIGPQRQDQMVQVLDERLQRAETDVQISAMDETNPSIFVQNWNAYGPASRAAVDQLNVHTYGTSDRMIVRDIAKANDKPLWMSEVEGNWDTQGGFNQTNIDNGLGMATRIVDDLRELEPEAWVFWQPVEDLYNMEKVEKLNWGSVFIDFDCNAEGNSERRLADGDADPSCRVLTNAKFNTVRNFTHHILPGDRLIPTNDPRSTAAIRQDGTGATVVHVNSGAEARTVALDLSGFGEIAEGATVTPIVTTESPADDVTANALVEGEPVAVDAATQTARLTVPAKSVTTFVIDGVSGVSDDTVAFRDGETVQLLGVQSGRALAAEGTGLAIRTSAQTSAQGIAQAWTVRSLADEGTNRHRFALQNGDGRFLRMDGTTPTLVTADLETARGDGRFHFLGSTADGTTFSVLSASAERVLDVGGGSSADGASVGVWTSNNGENQRWRIASTAATGVDTVFASAPAETAPSLPETVTVRYADGASRTAAVTWDLPASWPASGVVTVAGTGTDVFGAAFEATAEVELGAFASVQPVSVTTFAGATVDAVQDAAPTTAPAEIALGGPGYATAVEWDFSGVDDADLAEPGVVTVPGTAASNVAGAPRLPAVLSIIVTAATDANVAPDSSPSATFTESASYAVSRTINRIADDKGWSNWRSGTKNAQDTLTYDLAERERVERFTIRFYRDGGATWAQSLRVDHRLTGGAWTSGQTVTVPEQASGAPVIEVPMGGVVADEVRVVLTARPATHMIVSEVEISAARPSASSVADLARLAVGGTTVAGLDDREEYEVVVDPGSATELTAVPVDRDARVSITQPADAEGTGTVRVTAPDGTERTYRVVVREEAVLDLETTVTTRCLAGKVVVSVTVRNPSDAAAVAAIRTPWGSKSGIALAPGKASSHAFTTRASSIPEGELTVTGTQDGVAPFSATLVVPARTCS